MLRARLLAPLVLAALTAVAGCAAPGDEEAGNGADAVTTAQGQLASSVKSAHDLAERIAARDPLVPVVPVPGDAIPSKRFGSHSAALFVESSGKAGYVLYPESGTPDGSFGLLLVDPSSQILAVAAHVPDSAPGAAAAADGILAAMVEDGAEAVGTIRGASLVSELATPVLRRLLSIFAQTASRDAEAIVASKVSSGTWKDFAATFDRAAVDAARKQSLALRQHLGTRRAYMIQAPTENYIVEETLEDMPKTIFEALGRKLGPRARDSAIVLSGDGLQSTGALAWALANRVPVVIRSTQDVPKLLAESAFRARQYGNHAVADALEAAAKDPSAVALVKTYTTPKGLNFEEDLLSSFTAAWSVADAVISFRFGSAGRSAFETYFRGRFSDVTVLPL